MNLAYVVLMLILAWPTVNSPISCGWAFPPILRLLESMEKHHQKAEASTLWRQVLLPQRLARSLGGRPGGKALEKTVGRGVCRDALRASRDTGLLRCFLTTISQQALMEPVSAHHTVLRTKETNTTALKVLIIWRARVPMLRPDRKMKEKDVAGTRESWRQFWIESCQKFPSFVGLTCGSHPIFKGQRIPEAYRGSMYEQNGVHILSIGGLQHSSGHDNFFYQLSSALNPIPWQSRVPGPVPTCLRNTPRLYLYRPLGSVEI